MRKIYVTEKQLHEALGMSLSYLNNSENGASASHYDSEITVNGNITGETKTTMDKISKSKAPRSYFGARKRMATINCSIDSNKKKLFETTEHHRKVSQKKPLSQMIMTIKALEI